MLRSFQRLTSADPGFRPDHALLVRFGLPYDSGGMVKLRADRRRVVERVSAVPGVVAAGATTFAPLTQGSGEGRAFVVPGQPTPAAGEEPRLTLLPVSEGYFRAVGIPLLAGQDVVAAAGDSTAGPAAVISRTMAERFWPGRSPIGETFLMGGNALRVVGVAGDVRSARLDSIGGYAAYVPERLMTRTHMSLVVRTAGDPMALAGPVRDAIREVFPRQALQEVVPLEDKLSEAAATARFFTVLVTDFGALALALAAIGLYGVVAYVVRQREREMGVRLALGASPSRVLGLMLRHGMAPVAVGLVVGLAGALLATRVLRSLLFEVSATDPATFAAGAALLGAVALLAAYVPSRRVSRIDPAVTLRAE
jgi:predicted permease